MIGQMNNFIQNYPLGSFFVMVCFTYLYCLISGVIVIKILDLKKQERRNLNQTGSAE